MSTDTTSPTDDQTLRGGEEVEVTFAKDGKKQTVLVRQLPISEYGRCQDAFNDEPKLVEIACGRPDGWAMALTPESYTRLAEAMDRQNADFFAYFQRHVVRRVMPLVQRLPNGSQDSQPKPGSR